MKSSSNEAEAMPAAANTQAVSAEKPPAGPAKAKEAVEEAKADAEAEEGKAKADAEREENAVVAEVPAKPKYEYKPGKNGLILSGNNTLKKIVRLASSLARFFVFCLCVI